VLLIAGSGPQTRDEDVLGHKEFLPLLKTEWVRLLGQGRA